MALHDDFPTPIARYSLFVLKVPLNHIHSVIIINTKQANKQSINFCIRFCCIGSYAAVVSNQTTHYCGYNSGHKLGLTVMEQCQ